MGCHAFLQGIFLIQGLNPLLLHLLQVLYLEGHLGNPCFPLDIKKNPKSMNLTTPHSSCLHPIHDFPFPWSFSLPPLLPLTIQPSLSRHSQLFKTWIRSHSLAQKSPCSFLSYFEEIQTSHKASAQLSSSLPLTSLLTPESCYSENIPSSHPPSSWSPHLLLPLPGIFSP